MANKYIDIDNKTDSKWKNKYLASLEELEEKERYWQESETILRALISRLSDAADDSSSKLNQQLSVLKDAINKGVPATKLKKAIEEVTESIHGLHTLQEKKKIGTRKILLDLIQQTRPAGKIEKKLGKLGKKIAKTTSIKDMQPLVTELAHLLVYGLTLAERKDQEGGFLSGLLGRKEKPAQADNDAEPEAEQQTSEQTEQTITTALSDHQLLDNAIASLQALLEKMILPVDLQVEANLIKRQLEEHADENTFVQALQQTVAITADILARIKKEKQDIEAFLKQLTTRLHELDKDIRETARIRQLSQQNGREMTDGIKSQMDTMEQGINTIQNLEELKTAIQSRVIMLRNHVDTFILKENKHEQQAEKVIAQLKNKLQQMEDETRELKQQIEKEREQTLKDALTGVANRLAYEERLSLELANFRRNKTPFTLVVWDIDFFKKVNDNYGHAAGDQVLKLVASILSQNLRETDFFARYGGEEFVCLLPDTDINGAQLITDKLREQIAQTQFHFREQPVKVTVSAGFAEVRPDESGEALFIRADKALYHAKENGRNKCVAAR